MVRHVKHTYCSDHFIIGTNIIYVVYLKLTCQLYLNFKKCNKVPYSKTGMHPPSQHKKALSGDCIPMFAHKGNSIPNWTYVLDEQYTKNSGNRVSGGKGIRPRAEPPTQPQPLSQGRSGTRQSFDIRGEFSAAQPSTVCTSFIFSSKALLSISLFKVPLLLLGKERDPGKGD